MTGKELTIDSNYTIDITPTERIAQELKTIASILSMAGLTIRELANIFKVDEKA